MQGRPSDARPQLEPHRRLGNRDRLKNKRPTNLKRVFTPLPSCPVDTSPMGLSVNIYNIIYDISDLALKRAVSICTCMYGGDFEP